MTESGENFTYTLFEYVYVDGSNYKAFGEIWLSGSISDDQRDGFVAKLESGQFFVAEQIPIPPLYDELFKYSGGATSDDHGWHIFVGFRQELKSHTSTSLVVWGSVEKFLGAFRTITEWDPSLSENFSVGKSASC